MSETLKFEGRLALLKKDLAELDIMIRSELSAVRNLLDPFAGLEDLKTAEAASLAVSLDEARTRWLETRATIRRIERELGR